MPIYDDLPSQSATIIGFVYVQWSYDGVAILTLNPPANTSHIGSQNVSGIIALPLPPNLNQQDISLLFQDNAGLANPLYAPVLVNHYIGSIHATMARPTQSAACTDNQQSSRYGAFPIPNPQSLIAIQHPCRTQSTF